MATGGELSKSVLHSSEEYVECPCSFCMSRDSKSVESIKFCVECNSNLCKACTTWHENFPAMSGHQVVDITMAALVKRQYRLKGEYTVKVRGDSPVCNITDSCLLPNGALILTDYINKSVKHLDTTYNIKRYLSLFAEPNGVCSTGSNEVALTLNLAMKVQFVLVEDTAMSATRSFSVGDYCRGICCSKDELFICCGSSSIATSGHVRVYNLFGTLLRTIQDVPTGQPMFSNTRYITASSSGNKLHVTDKDKGVVTIDRTGNILSTYNDTDLEGPFGICTLDNDDLLVCGGNSYNVHHIGRDGKKLAVVLKKRDGVKHPRSVSYDAVNSRIIVSSFKSDNIRVYELI